MVILEIMGTPEQVEQDAEAFAANEGRSIPPAKVDHAAPPVLSGRPLVPTLDAARPFIQTTQNTVLPRDDASERSSSTVGGAPKEICRAYLQGRCIRRTICPYSHTARDRNSSTSESPPLPMPTPHVTSSTPHASLDPMQGTVLRSLVPRLTAEREVCIDRQPSTSRMKELCRDNINGRCKRGDRCPYAHNPADAISPDFRAPLPTSAPRRVPSSPSGFMSTTESEPRTIYTTPVPEMGASRASPAPSASSEMTDASWWSALTSWKDKLSEDEGRSSATSTDSAGPSTPQMAHTMSRVAVHSDIGFSPIRHEPKSYLASGGTSGAERRHPPQAVEDHSAYPATRLDRESVDNICFDWSQFGRCNRGNWCNYVHLPPRESALKPQELRRPDTASFNSLHVCLEWMEGRCTRQFCKYSHPAPSTASLVRMKLIHLP